MNFFKKVLDGLKKAFGFAKVWYVRAGLGKFLDQHVATALQIIMRLAVVNNNAAFHTWQEQAFQELKAIAGNVSDNWIAIALNTAYELFKAVDAPNKEKV